ncbi:hypothetical protein, partial [Escherichia coli]|uniref:hypothetical protein n=1 Tax=Escherichia coli TaxID=562 RepID=UPI0011BAB0AB
AVERRGGMPVSISRPGTVEVAAVVSSNTAVGGDDEMNGSDKGADLTLSGSTSGVELGRSVTVTFGGKTYPVNVAGDGSWAASVPAADFAELRDGDATVQA